MGIRFLKLSVIYFTLGILIGMYMGMTSNYDLVSTHTHVNTLGWLSMALFGLIYHVVPSIADNKLANIHFWLFNIGFPIMALGKIFETQLGNGLPGIGGLLVAIAVIIFAINVLTIKKSK